MEKPWRILIGNPSEVENEMNKIEETHFFCVMGTGLNNDGTIITVLIQLLSEKNG